MSISERDRVIVLAAGHGRRMGGPKAMMQVEGRAWWLHQVRRLRELSIESLWVVSHTVREGIASEHGEFVTCVEANPDDPMFESLLAGMRAFEGHDLRGMFVLPVDVPVPSLGVWQKLAGSVRPAQPVYAGRRGHPVYLPWEWWRHRATQLPNAHDARLDRLIAGESVRVEVDDPSICQDLNTPEDLERWLNQS